ncbi:MAG: hypothetical protein C5B49_02130 [Bdellovibrio sp.]|nr:MAG: hypothetical protein C5B49_02130 [Bdellovibrio sp.]
MKPIKLIELIKAILHVLARGLALAGIIILFQCCGQAFKILPFESSSQIAADSTNVKGSPYVQVGVGEFMVTDAGKTAGLTIAGRAMIVRTGESTETYFQIKGLLPNTAYTAAHVHNLPCSVDAAGGHYKIDPAVATATDTNEIWFSFMTDATGQGFSPLPAAEKPFASSEAQSIVIHDPANTANRLACVDFGPERKASVKGGTWGLLTGGTTANLHISGNGLIVRNANGRGQTHVRFSVSGLTPNTTYPTHVHNSNCATAEGGTHYKLNAAVTEMVASTANEIWPTLTTNANGNAFVDTLVDGHVARADALALVIHDPVNTATRLACLDLASPAGFVDTETGLTRQITAALPPITGTAQMERTLDGKTKISVTLANLKASTAYVAHVHALPCRDGDGGGHYKIDPANAASVEANEMWLHLQTDAMGAVTYSAPPYDHIARPEAQSVVLHDPTDSAKLACADLY